jgi:3-oxocholest-4-en-26-oyl-CoA dehydrogenase beta subunit
MDFGLTDDQLELQALANRILSDKVTDERQRQLDEAVAAAPDTDRFDEVAWAELGKAGLLGIALPESAGGGGLGMIEQCLVLQEVGRSIAAVPVVTSIVSGALPIATFGTPEQIERWARPAADGAVILTAALVEPLNPDPLHPVTTATPDGDTWRITGAKTCVAAATRAAAILIPAATPDGAKVFIVEAGAAGLTITPQHTTNGDTEGHVQLDNVVASGVLEGHDVLAWMVERTTLALCAVQLGVCEEALRRTASYSIGRIQFERPIATFQAVGHRCADSYIDVEGIRLTLWQAAWLLSEGLPASMEVEVAKLWAAEGGHRVAHAAVHIHGGMGVATEYPIHRYFVHAKQIEFSLGSAMEQRLRIGARLAAQPA